MVVVFESPSCGRHGPTGPEFYQAGGSRDRRCASEEIAAMAADSAYPAPLPRPARPARPLERPSARYASASSSDFAVVVDAGPTRCEFSVRGDLDLAVSQRLIDIVVDCLEQTFAPEVVIDLSAVPFIDSTGLGALVGIRNAARLRDRRLVLRSPSPQAARLLAVTGLDHIFTITWSEQPPAAAAEA
jgi:anti-sigma B factor antagonist